jgi:threonine aldolase
MYKFECDYHEGAHPKILERLASTNMMQTSTYGTDEFCLNATRMIKDLCGSDSCAVHFCSSGTLTNLIVTSSMLRPHQGIISATTGHINSFEAGAIEAKGHKVIAVPTLDGKISADEIANIIVQMRVLHVC